MPAPTLSPAQREELLDGLAEALEQLQARTCPDMVPLWLESTREARSELGGDPSEVLPFEPSPRYLGLGKGGRSRYRGLAAWRHATLWRSALAAVPDDDFRRAVEAVYFSPFPSNEPPYAWSSRASEAPAVDQFPSATTLKHWAREGCQIILERLRAERRALEERRDWCSELTSLFLRPGTRDSLHDVLKLEDIQPGAPPRGLSP